MMKKILSFSVVLFFALGIAAQQISESVAAIGDLSVPACTVSMQKDAKMVKEAMEQYMKENKLKAKNQQGWLAAVQQVIPTISASPITLYTKVEEQGKRKDKSTVVTIAVVGNDLTIDQSDLRDNAKNWLFGFVQYIARYEATLQMNAEQKNLDKANKEATKAAANLSAIEKDIANDQKKIESKKADNEKLKEKIQKNEQEIKELQENIEKRNKKKATAQQKVTETQQSVNEAQGEVDRYRQMAQ